MSNYKEKTRQTFRIQNDFFGEPIYVDGTRADAVAVARELRLENGVAFAVIEVKRRGHADQVD